MRENSLLFRYIIVLLVVMFGLFSKANAKSSKYEDGQVWILKSGEYKGVEVLIAKVEDHPLQQEVIHITVLGPISNDEGKTVPEMSHLPFAKKALNKSNLKMLNQEKTYSDTWQEGYEYWNLEASEGRAGKFSVTVSEAIDIVFENVPLEEDIPDTKLMNPSEIAFSDYIHESFSDEFLARIKYTTDTFEAIDGITYLQAIDLYKRDLKPEDNIVIWEEMARVFLDFCKENCESIEKKKEVYRTLLLASMFPKEEVYTRVEPQILTIKEVKQLANSYKLKPAPLPVVRE